MDAFSYLSVLLSVILGLAIQQVLLGYRGLALSRDKVRWYAPPLIWSGLVLLIVVQHWWSSFGLASRAGWSFAAFATVLVQTALIYMMAGLVLPDVPSGDAIDLKVHYYRERPIFFGAGVAAILWNCVREYMLYDRLPHRLDLGFNALFLALALTAIWSRRERLHEALAGLMVILFTAYIALLFARL
jgi:hypothetical protein